MTEPETIIDVKLGWSVRYAFGQVFPLLKPRLVLDSRESTVLQFPLSDLLRIEESLFPIALACNDKQFRMSCVIPVTMHVDHALRKHNPDFDEEREGPTPQPVSPETELSVELSVKQRKALNVLFPDWSSNWNVTNQNSLDVNFPAVRFQFVRDSLMPYAIACGNDTMQHNLTEAFLEMWNVLPLCIMLTE